MTTNSGVDFLGWVHFPHHRVLRTATKKRMLRRIKKNPISETLNSYFGIAQTWKHYKNTKRNFQSKFLKIKTSQFNAKISYRIFLRLVIYAILTIAFIA